ncbi:hypothetical protein COHA_010498 [Chlorella ohadii]|uniref:Uncharacterized protein n=1 Tax=Chlorella ohadii TaxID=2649997 RepID=A0AAD5DJR4_9CHLO|nr:hypothetical protein COHA_010498 [Chlorella ohadii]
MAAVGPLLTFADTRHERAFAAHFHTSHRSNDTFFFRMGAVVNLLALTLPLRQRQWWPVCFGLFESAVLASAALTTSKAPTLYLRWRTAIVAAVYSLHVLISQTLAPSIASPGCRGNLLGFWLQELNMSLAPWIALISLSTPLLLKHAVLAQAAVVATTLACSRARQQLSFSLCELSGQRYVQAAGLLSAAAACVLPPPLGGALLDFQRQHLRQGPTAFHAVQTALLLCLAYCAGLRLYALTNHLIAKHVEREDGDAVAAAAALFAVTAKSLESGGSVQANAREQVQRRHYSVMDQLKEVSERQQAGESLPDDPPPSCVIQRATRLKELTRQLRQFSSQGLSSITSPRTARQICRIFRLGDAAFEEWEAQQRGRGRKAGGGKGSGGKGRRARTPSPKKSGKRKTPERQPRGASRLAPDSSPVAAAAAAAQGVPQAQRRRSCEEEGDSLVPKQLFVGAGAGSADSLAEASAAPSQPGGQQGQQRQACDEWAAFKAFMASPRRPPASSSSSAPASAMPQPVERPQQAAQQAQQQPMDVDSSQQGSPISAASPAAVEEQQAVPLSLAAGGLASSPSSRAAAAPLSPRQAALAGTPPDLTPEKLLPAPGLAGGLYSAPVDKENGSSLGSWAWGSSLDGPEGQPAPGATAAAAPAAPANRSRPHAAVRRGLLVLESPATERAAAAREKMAAEAAEVLAADVLRLLR